MKMKITDNENSTKTYTVDTGNLPPDKAEEIVKSYQKDIDHLRGHGKNSQADLIEDATTAYHKARTPKMTVIDNEALSQTAEIVSSGEVIMHTWTGNGEENRTLSFAPLGATIFTFKADENGVYDLREEAAPTMDDGVFPGWEYSNASEIFLSETDTVNPMNFDLTAYLPEYPKLALQIPSPDGTRFDIYLNGPDKVSYEVVGASEVALDNEMSKVTNSLIYDDILDLLNNVTESYEYLKDMTPFSLEAILYANRLAAEDILTNPVFKTRVMQASVDTFNDETYNAMSKLMTFAMSAVNEIQMDSKQSPSWVLNPIAEEITQYIYMLLLNDAPITSELVTDSQGLFDALMKARANLNHKLDSYSLLISPEGYKLLEELRDSGKIKLFSDGKSFSVLSPDLDNLFSFHGRINSSSLSEDVILVGPDSAYMDSAPHLGLYMAADFPTTRIDPTTFEFTVCTKSRFGARMADVHNQYLQIPVRLD